MDEIIVLHVNPTVADEISRDLKECEGVTPFSAMKSSIDGSIPTVIITVFAAKEAIKLVRDVVLRYIDRQRIDAIKMGTFEAKNASPETIERLFRLYTQSLEGTTLSLPENPKGKAK